MTCDDVRLQPLRYERGQLSTLHRNDIRAHLQACPACAHEVTADALLTETLERRLPQHAAPLGLKRRLAAQWPRPSPHQPSWWVRWRLSVVPALATATVLLIAVPIYYGQFGRFQSDRSASMMSEAVTNHLRVKDVRRLARASSRDLRGTGGRQSELLQSIGHASAQGGTLRSPEADLLQGRTARERPDVQRLVVLKVPQRADSESALPALKSTLERRWRCGDEYL